MNDQATRQRASSTPTVLLIAPPYASLKGVLPTPASHLGLLYLAASLESQGISTAVMVADLHAGLEPAYFVSMKQHRNKMNEYQEYVAGGREHQVWRAIEEAVAACNPDIVGITATTPAIDSARRVARIVRQVRPAASVVLGGPHATLLPEHTLCCDDIDFVLRGEGDRTLCTLVRELDKSTPDLSRVPSLSRRTAYSGFKHNPRAATIGDLDALPAPNWGAMILPDEHEHLDLSVIATRGCAYRCAFCADRQLWGSVRHRSGVSVAKEVETLLTRYPLVKEVYFIDGTLTYNRRFLLELCAELSSRDLGASFYCTARFDNVDEQSLGALVGAGFQGVYLGAESGDGDMLARMNKRITPDVIEEKTLLVRQHGLQSLVSILLGAPGETAKSLANTISLMNRLEADIYDVNCYVPLPGTEWYDALSEESKGRISWGRFGYKGSYPFLFEVEGKQQLNALVDEIYEIADQRLAETLARASANT